MYRRLINSWAQVGASRLPLLRGMYSGMLVLLLWSLLALVTLVEFQPVQRLEVGLVSQRDIRAPRRISYSSAIRTEREREKEAALVEPIYSAPDRSQAIQQTSTAATIATFLDSVRSDPYASDELKHRYISALQHVQFDPELIQIILTLPEEEWREVDTETRRLVDQIMRGEIRESRLQQILRNLPNQISFSLTEEQARVVKVWASSLIVPNTHLDVERTEQARQAAREKVAPYEVIYEANQIIVREGEIVTPEQVEALQELGLQQPERSRGAILATLLFLFFIVMVLGLYLYRLHSEHWNNPRAMALIGALLVTLTLGARILMPDHLLLSYLFPTATAAMLLGVLLGIDVAVLVTVLLSLIIGFLTHSIPLVSYTFISGIMAALLLWRVERLGAFVWTGGIIGLVNVGIVLVFALQQASQPWVEIAVLSGMALLNGVASASLALAGFYVLSNFLGIMTFIQLMELARPTHPLFRNLLLKAPGTYAHTIIVSNLAERAAEAIGADMLLVRVGAYYHDVGKMINPHYFVENQADGVNLHDALDDPYRSAEIIVGHVIEGEKLARKYKLPRRIIEFITQHHGTTTVAWFYHKACEQEGEENVEMARFCYPGPRPQSRESAILMLADSVEATARAVKPAGAAEIEGLVRKIIVTKLGEGQLDECGLTLREMDLIRGAFVGVMQGIYHPRISYPEPKKGQAALAAPDKAALASQAAEEEQHEKGESRADRDRSAVGTTG